MTQVAVKKLNTAGASATDETAFLKEVRIAQLASATCQRACRILGCCCLDGSPCLVMSLYSSSAAKRLETLQGTEMSTPLEAVWCEGNLQSGDELFKDALQGCFG